MKIKQDTFRAWNFFFIIIISWTILITVIIVRDFFLHNRQTDKQIRNTALATFNKDIAFREWASKHGGVYVPVDSITTPNPYLSHIEERDIKTPSGKQLTLMNPAYMSRQMNEYFSENYGIIGHITSLNPLRPENKPDEWERMALEKFEEGITEVSEYSSIDGKPYFRLMRPFTVQESCLKCHAHQGYKLGDIRGGIGVTLPVESYNIDEKEAISYDLVTYIVLWLLGILGLYFAVKNIQSRINRQREVEQKLKLHAEQTPLAVIEWDLNFKVVSWNKSAELVFGHTKEEANGQHASFIVSKEFRSGIDKIWEGLVKNKDGFRSTNENITKDNKKIYCDWYNTPLVDSDGKVIGVTSLVQDVTETLKSKQELIINEKKYRLLFENMTAGFALHEMIYDENGKPIDYRFLEINPAFEKLTGAKASDLIGKTVLETLPNTEQHWIDNFGKVASTGEPIAYENYAQELSKYYDTWAFSPVKGQFAVVFTDITERKIAEQKLEKYKEHLEHVVKERTEELEASNEEIRAVNEELYDNNEKLEKYNMDLNTQQDEILQLNEELKQSNEELYSTNENLSLQAIVLEETIKNLKHAQAQLVQAEKMASLGILTAGVAHEINNPVNFITSSIYGLESFSNSIYEVISAYDSITNTNCTDKLKSINKLRKDTDFDFKIKSLQQIISNVNEGTQRITDIISSLRTFSVKDEDVMLITDLHENIDATLTILQHETKNRIKIEKEYGDLPKIRCYPGKINQVFINIIMNAIQAINNKGTIVIKTVNLQESVEVCISFKDSGVGMTQETQNKIFEPFFSTKKEGTGTGLGLYISYGIIEQHKGRIEINSEINKGTEFKIYLPYNQ